MRLKKGNKEKYEFDLMLISDNKSALQVNFVKDRLNRDEMKIIENHLKNAALEITGLRNNHAKYIPVHGVGVMEISIFEFLKRLETGSGDEVLELVIKFQSGGIDFTDFDYEVEDE